MSEPTETPDTDAITVQEAVPQWLLDALASTSVDEDITITLTRGKWGVVIAAMDELICRLEEREAGREASGLRRSLESSYCIVHDALMVPTGAEGTRSE